MNSTTKADSASICMAGINVPSEVPEADLEAYVLIDGHALIQAL